MKTLLFAALVLAAPAGAAENAGMLSLEAHGGGAAPLGSRWVRDNGKLGPYFGGAVRLGLSDDLDGTFSYDSVQMYKRQAIRLEPFLFSLVKSFSPLGSWTPEARLGAGPVVVTQARLNGQNGSYTTWGVRLGGGVEHPLCSRSSVGGWVDWLYATHSNAGSTDAQAVLFGLSLSWKGGAVAARGETPAPVKAQAPAKAPAKPSFAPPAAPATPATPDEVQEPPTSPE